MRIITSLLLAFIFIIMLSGCENFNSSSTADPGAPQDTADASEPADYYYDFDDILVPKEMELQNKDSFILETPEAKSGVMVFTGSVEIVSLTNFFINNMTKDNWNMRSAFKSNRTILVFEKSNRYCIINLTDGQFKTLLEIWVSPRSSSMAAQ